MATIRISPSALSASVKLANSPARPSPTRLRCYPAFINYFKHTAYSTSPPPASSKGKPSPTKPSSAASPSPKTRTSRSAPARASAASSYPIPQSSTLTPELIAKFRELWPNLPEENASLLEGEMRTMAPDWLEVLKGDMEKESFLELKRFLLKEQTTETVYPPADDIYAFSRLSSISGIKLVIIGQDPYHAPKQAHGLAFSVRKGVYPPPSLRNIYKELKNEYPSFIPPKHGDLTALAEQGVLLLNTALTVRASEAASHSKAGWEPFTRSIISHIASGSSTSLSSSTTAQPSSKGKVFLCWGKHAENVAKKAGVDPMKNLILRSVHPSPLSADRGFFGTGHFKEASEWLEKTWGEGEGIDWTKLGS